MGVDIGPKIGIDGEAEFRKELNNINQQIKTLGSEMKAVTSAFDANDKSQEALTAQAGVLNRQIEAQEKKLSSLQDMLDKSSQKYGENDTKTLRWAQAVQDATADLNKMRSQLSKTEQEMDGLGDAADDVADAMDDVGSASSGLGDTLKSAILGGGLVAGIQGIVGGIRDLVESTTEYRRIAASLEVSSQAAGYSAQETAVTYRQLYGVLGDDQTAATATANLQAVGLAQDQLTQLTNAAIGAWATYGDSIPIDGLSEAINETIKVGKVTGTFADTLNWAGVSEDAFNEKLAAASTPAERANLVLQQLASQGLVQAGEAWRTTNSDIVAANEATAQLTGTISEFGAIFSPVVTSAKENVNGLLNGVLQVVQAFQKDGLSGAVSEAGTQLTALASSALSAASDFGSGIANMIPILTETVSGIVSNLATGIMNGLPLLAETASTLMGNLGQYLAENLPGMIQVGLSAVTAFTGSLAENVGLVVDAAIGLAKSLAQGLADSIPAIIENVPTIVSNIARVINENAPKIFTAAVELILTLVKGLIDSIPTIVENIPKIAKAIFDALLAFNWLNLGKTIITGIGNGLKSMISFVKEIAGQIVSAIKGGISALPEQMLTIGKNIVRGLWDGVKSMGKWVLDNIKKFVGGIVGGIKEFLGIHSPSTVFETQIGKYMAQGIGVGFEDEMTDVAARMQRSIPVPTIDTVNNAAAGMVNGLSTMAAGQSFPSTIVLKLENGAEIARWLLPDLRRAGQANPEVASGV